MTIKTLIIGAALIVGFALIAPKACTQPGKTERQLTSMGYKDVIITGYDFFACSESDSFSTGFKATAPDGSKISGVYCAGLMKAGTVRFY